jgi:prepilin-type N-terminal cleavage/methylation domain-containing protein
LNVFYFQEIKGNIKNNKVYRMKIRKNTGGGFTLVEILLVIAMIGILAATIFVSLNGQRKRAKLASAMESIRSVMPVAVECYLMNKGLGTWNDATTGGGAICAGNAATWPTLGATGCVYNNLDNVNKRWNVMCDSTGTPTYISCFAKDGANCCPSNATYTCN